MKITLELPDRVSIAKLVLCQPNDTCQADGEQKLTIEAVDNGAGHFFRLKTSCWSIDGQEDLNVLAANLKVLQNLADQESK